MWDCTETVRVESGMSVGSHPEMCLLVQIIPVLSIKLI